MRSLLLFLVVVFAAAHLDAQASPGGLPLGTPSMASGASGSGAAGQLTLWNGTSSLIGSEQFKWSVNTSGEEYAALSFRHSASGNYKLNIVAGNSGGAGAFTNRIQFNRSSTSSEQGLMFYSGNNFDTLDWFVGQADIAGNFAGKLAFWPGGLESQEMLHLSQTTGVVFNDPMLDRDFVVRSDTLTAALTVDGGSGCVGAGAVCEAGTVSAGGAFAVSKSGAEVFVVGSTADPGKIVAQNDTSGAIGAIWLPPRSIDTVTGALPACDSSLRGAQVTIDDTDDSKPMVQCTCVLKSDNTTHQWYGWAPELGTAYDCPPTP